MSSKRRNLSALVFLITSTTKVNLTRMFHLLNMSEYFRYMYIKCILANSYKKAGNTLQTYMALSTIFSEVEEEKNT